MGKQRVGPKLHGLFGNDGDSHRILIVESKILVWGGKCPERLVRWR